MGFSLGISSREAPWEVGKIVNETQNLFLWLLEKKQQKKDKAKRPDYKSNSDQEEPYFKFILLELTE